MFTRKKYIYFLLIILIFFSAFFRFYNLNWGAPFYFHPDERNIASSVSQLKFPDQMNPRFFAYGSLPIYTIYFTGFFLNLFLQLLSPKPYPLSPSFDQAILISRFFSAVFSLALIPLLFFLGKKLKDERAGLIAAFFASVSVGLIQFAHFGTFEMWLTFFSLLFFLLCLKILERKRVSDIIFFGITFGVLAATKVSHLVLLPLPILALAFQNMPSLFKKSYRLYHSERSISGVEESHTTNLQSQHSGMRSLGFGRDDQKTNNILSFLKQMILFLFITSIIFFLTNPFVLLDYSSFIGSMKYESDVVLGTMKVFYTGEFMSSLPVIFQFFHIYPFLINPVLTIIFIPSFVYLLFISLKTKNHAYIILNTFYLILFLSQAFLYAKWTRYMMPTLPFVYLIISVALVSFWGFISKKFKVSSIKYFVLSIFTGINLLFGISYFIVAFVQGDTRFAAKSFAKQYIPPNAPILSEVYDMGITPFNDSFHNITLYNFYDLDNNSFQYTLATLEEQLSQSDYIILPSQRILKVRLEDAKDFPKGHIFYSALSAQNNGFQKIYETPCDIFCKITYLGSPVYSFEQTASVFDRPTVFIFKKNENL